MTARRKSDTPHKLGRFAPGLVHSKPGAFYCIPYYTTLHLAAVLSGFLLLQTEHSSQFRFCRIVASFHHLLCDQRASCMGCAPATHPKTQHF